MGNFCISAFREENCLICCSLNNLVLTSIFYLTLSQLEFEKVLGQSVEFSTMLDMPAEILSDIRKHVGDEKKFVSVADAIRTACRKLLDQLDEIDIRNGR